MSDYDFRDLNIYTGTEDTTYPSEAMIFNGTLIEQAIPEYRTLQVTGRELLGQSLTTIKVGNQDGQRLKQYSRPEREITVKYHIKATSNSRYREIFYQLNSILSGSEHKISFLDQPDIYFIGTLEDVDIPDGGSNEIVSTFTIYCADPYAHSTTEDKFTFSDTATQTITSDFSSKVVGNLNVPHVAYRLDEPIAAAISSPDKYTSEISQELYSQLYSHDGNSAQLISKESLTIDTGHIVDDKQFDELGELESITVAGDNITIKGWYATDESKTKPYRNVVITTQFWGNEIFRKAVTGIARPDIATKYPKIAGADMSGFEITLPYDPRMDNRRLLIHFRYSEKEDGTGAFMDYTAYATVDGTLRQTTPHFMIKVDVLQAIESKQPGFWTRLGLSDRLKQREWLKTGFSFGHVQAFVNGHGPTKVNATIQLWDNTNDWVGTQSTNSSQLSQLQYNWNSDDEFSRYVDENGYLYVNIYPADDATKAGDSYINLDYFSFDISVSAATTNSMTIVNDGPMPTPIRFEMINNGQNGFLGIQGKNNEQILIGKPDQMDGQTVSKSERLYTLDQKRGLDQFKLNDGHITSDIAEHANIQIGNFDNPLKTSRWALWNDQTAAGGSFANSWGDGDLDGWHGPSVYAEFGKDSQGSTGATNFTARGYISSRFGNFNQGGLQELNISDANGNVLVGFSTWKNVNIHNGIRITIGNKRVYTDDNNARWDQFFGQVVFKRHGDVYTVTIQDSEGGGGAIQTFTYTDPASAKQPATGFTYWKAHYGSDWYSNMYNDLYDFWFQKDNIDSYVDIPNVFSSGDKVKVTGDDGKVVTTNNGLLFLDWQDIGSKPVLAYPGANIVSFMYSSFADRPNVTAYIRKKYL